MSTATQQNEFETSTGVLWDDPEAGSTWLVSIIGVIILAALVIFLSVIYFHGEQAEIVEKIVDKSDMHLVEMVRDQKGLLNESGSYSADVGGHQVTRQRIPVAKAMQEIAANPALAVPAAGAVPATPAAPTVLAAPPASKK